MEFIERFRHDIKAASDSDFESLALSAFKFQAEQNQCYKSYLSNLKIDVNNINSLIEIPFLPIEFFKSHHVVSSDTPIAKTFKSSGTTSTGRSKHHLDRLNFYLEHSTRIFESCYGPLNDFAILALLPSYLEQGDSSLIAMIDHFITLTKSEFSGYYLQIPEQVQQAANKARATGKKVIVFGVSYALLDLAESGVDLSGCIVMETGGMKGRRKEMIRTDLHHMLCKGLNVDRIHSEYGMTELLSQTYSTKNGEFHEKFYQKVLIRDINDPFSYVGVGKTGGINVIDLGNIFSCCFVETKDIGRKRENGDFEVLGRFDNSDLRGCNLMLV